MNIVDPNEIVDLGPQIHLIGCTLSFSLHFVLELYANFVAMYSIANCKVFYLYFRVMK